MKGSTRLAFVMILLSAIILSSISAYGQSLAGETLTLSDIEGLFTVVASATTTPSATLGQQDAANGNIIFSENFESVRDTNQTLPDSFFYRSDTLPLDFDEKGWPWMPLSADSFEGDYSLKYDLSSNQGENVISRKFSVEEGPIGITFEIKTNMNFIGEGDDEGIEFLFYRTGPSDDPACMDEMRYRSPGNFKTVERETEINVTLEDSEASWESVSMEVGPCPGATGGFFYVTSAPDNYSGWILIDNIVISELGEGAHE